MPSFSLPKSFPFSKSVKPVKPDTPAVKPSAEDTAVRPSGTDKKAKSPAASQAHPLDGLTGGAFSAPTSGERATRIRNWLSSNPTPEQIAEVYKDLANRDKGAARPLKEKLDEIKRSKGQEAAATEWASRAEHLLGLPRLNLADALAWQRDAAKAGAPLSREPLAGLKGQIAERIKTIEDLQHRTQVQREAAVLIAQRIDVLSIKPWREALSVLEALGADVSHWQAQAGEIASDANWPSVDGKFAPLLEASRSQLLAVWEAFQAALATAVKADAEPTAPLPAVPVWADELRSSRGSASHAAGGGDGEGAAQRSAGGGRPRMDPEMLKEMRAKSSAAVQEALSRLEHEVTEGHGKATPRVAAELRQTLKEHVRNIDSALEAAAHAALTSAGELEGWQRWRADQIREELLAKAEGLVAKPMGGRKQQDALRHLREQWKTSDQGGIPNHALWKRFDEACNEAYKTVEAWLEASKAQSETIKAERQLQIDAIHAWHQEMQASGNTDWKQHIRSLNGFVTQWREAGHLNEKLFAEIQPLWAAAMAEADAALTAARAGSTERRQAMIEEAKVLGAEPQLRLDAVKHLQQRWQHEAQSVPIERRLEQKLWDAFRKPVDDAFQRKTAEREKAAFALGEFDRMVLQAAKALDAANASGDAQQIHAAAKALEAAVSGQAMQQASVDQQAQQSALADAAGLQPESSPASTESTENPENADFSAPNTAPDQETRARAAIKIIADDSPANLQSSPEAAPPAAENAPEPEAAAETAAVPAPKAPAAKPVIARRGDDRPGMKKAEPASAGGRGAGGKPGGGRDARAGGGSGGRAGGSGDNKFEPYRPERTERNDRGDDRPQRTAFADAPMLPRGPRLGDAAFRAQREAFDNANAALKKLAMQAHGEVLTHLLTAWEQRDAALVPTVQEFDKQITPVVRSQWLDALAKPAGSSDTAPEALLRLEMAAELPTPAEHLSARKLLQLQMLTRRNAAAPLETWGADAAKVLAAPFEAAQARRLQNTLKVLLKR